MNGYKMRLAALLLALTVLLTGCSGFGDFVGGFFQDFFGELNQLYYHGMAVVPYEDMVYERPDMERFRQTLDEVCRTALESDDLDAVIEGIYAFNSAYEEFYTGYILAYIRYSADLTDPYWDAEYTYCSEQTAEADAALDEMYRTLAASAHREALEAPEYFGEGFFDAYDGESIWDETFLSLMEQENDLINQYYELSAQSLEAEDYSDEYFEVYGTQMGDVFVELVRVRQRLADHAGYDSYAEFAYDFYYYRDYTPEQVTGYLEQIRDELVGMYVRLDEMNVWNEGNRYCPEEDTFAYVESCARNMGGVVADAFRMLQWAELYDIGYSENKYNSSFETYLFSYYEPFVFLNASRTVRDKLVFAHEFGHFASDYACVGSMAGVDVAEVHSQAMEYLSLCYADGGEMLEELKMADSLCIYVEQAAYAAFEDQVYRLRGEELTAQNVYALYASIGEAYGFDTWGWDSRDFVTIPHFFTNPMYIISYVVSNDAALQLYQLELEQAGEGLDRYEQCLYSSQSYFLAFVEESGLESPFDRSRILAVRQTFEALLN